MELSGVEWSGHELIEMERNGLRVNKNGLDAKEVNWNGEGME